MTILLAGLGPAGRGILTHLLTHPATAPIYDEGLVVIEPTGAPGGGQLGSYNVRSDSAAVVFAEAVQWLADDPMVSRSTALALINSLPDGESVALTTVDRLLRDATGPLIARARQAGMDVRMGEWLTRVEPGVNGVDVHVTNADAMHQVLRVSQLILAVGGVPWIPPAFASVEPDRLRHSDDLLRTAGLESTLAGLPPDPHVLVVGRAHSAFAVADRLLSSTQSRAWGPNAVTMVIRGPVRVTYPNEAAARADGVAFSDVDVCPSSGRVFRLSGLRGDSARRFRLGRDGIDLRLGFMDLESPDLARRTERADVVVAATGYRSASLSLVRDARMILPDGTLTDANGRVIPRIRTIGLGSGSRRTERVGGEASYTGPVDGVWHYQNRVAVDMVSDLLAETTPRPGRSPHA